MKLIVKPHKIKIIKDEPVNEKEINISKCTFEFDEVIPAEYIKKAFFTFDGKTYEQLIINNECDFPSEVLKEKGQIEIGVIAYETNGDEYVQRFNPSPVYYETWVGSLKENTETGSKPTPSQIEQLESAIGYLQENKQDKLISGVNIKTINNLDLLGEGNITIEGGGGGGGTYNYDELNNRPKINDVTLTGNKTLEELGIDIPDISNLATKEEVENKQDTLVSGENIKTINGNSLLGEGNLVIEGGGDASLQADLIVSNPIGKYTMEEKIDKGTMLETIFRGILSKTYYPTLTPPSASLSYSSNALYKVGATIDGKNATLSFNRGSINPQYTAESLYRSGEATSYKLVITGASENYDKTQDNGTFAIPAITRTSKGNIVLTGTVNYSAGVQPKDSDGANYESPLPAGSKSASKTIEFILPFYYGAVNSTDITSLTGLTEDLTKKGNKTYRITTADQYMCLIYDSSYGNITSILDANNFELINGWSKTTKTIEGQSYNVWTSNGKTTDTNAQFTFKF